jgi:hypothetical protein
MAIDNSPRVRQRAQLERKKNKRASYERILIVCEGSKTEPHYFKEIRAFYRLNTANVEVQPSQLGTAPIQVVEFARDLFLNGDSHKRIPPRAFDRVFAVFDRDEHDSYFDAIKLAKSLDGKHRNSDKSPVAFNAITSVPCFELWLLLHYDDVQNSIHRNEAYKRLKSHIHQYDKGMSGIFDITRKNIDDAQERANRLATLNNINDGVVPLTDIGRLVTLLIELGS